LLRDEVGRRADRVRCDDRRRLTGAGQLAALAALAYAPDRAMGQHPTLMRRTLGAFLSGDMPTLAQFFWPELRRMRSTAPLHGITRVG
jgi:hypothetical protein